MQHCFCTLNSMVRSYYSSNFHSKASYYKREDRNNPKDSNIRRLSNRNFRSTCSRTSQSTNSYCTKDHNYILYKMKAHNRKEISCSRNFYNHHSCNKNHLVHCTLKNHLQHILPPLVLHTADSHVHIQQFVCNNLPAIAAG